VTDINVNAKNLINYYCSMKVAPEYALLVKGPWGCGKSHLVKDCIKELEEANKEFKFLYVSLYGINDISDIEAKFFEQLNPTMNKILSNKKVMFASRIAKGVLKGALKIDLDGDDKPDVTASIAVPDINLADYLTDTSNCILVFDDLERCELGLQVVLGYINYFIEKDGYKVLIIADEEKLITKYSSDEEEYKYLDIKEKLIGKTVQVEPDVSSVFDNFVEELFPADNASDLVANNKVQVILNRNKDRVIQIFKQSKHENLRSLRKCILDLTQWIEIFDGDIKNNNEVLEHFLSIFVAISLEVHSGGIEPDHIVKLLGDNSYVLGLNDDGFEKEFKDYKEITGKYSINFEETLLDISDWKNWFDRGFIDQESVNNILRKSQYLQKQSAPEWKKLLHLFDLEQSDFEQLKASVWQSFESFEIIDFGEIKHVIGLYLYLAEAKLIDKTSSEVVTEAQEIVKQALANNKLDIPDSLNPEHDFGSYEGFAYFSNETKEFHEFNEYFCAEIYAYQAKQRKNETPNLLTLMNENVEGFTTLMCDQSGESKSFAYKSVLDSIPVDKFIKEIEYLSNANKKLVCQALRMRYRNQGGLSLEAEFKWINTVLEQIESKYKDINTLDSLVMIKFAEWIRPHVKTFASNTLDKQK